MPFYCPGCRKRIKFSDKFCGKCGRDLSLPISNTNSSNSGRQNQYHGTVHKCPFCGEIVPPLKSKCPSCGNEFRDVDSSNSVQQFSQQLIRLNNKANITTNGKNNTETELELIEKQKIALIQSFPIPNTKEDVVEFLVLANSNITVDSFFDHAKIKRELADAWAAKYEQAYQKACILLDDTAKLNIIHEDYIKKMDYVKKQREMNLKNARTEEKVSNVLLVVWVSVCMIFVIGTFVGCFKFFHYMFESVETENQRLELLLDEVNESINNSDYDNARSLISKMRFSSFISPPDEIERWDNIRQEVIERIDKLEAKEKDAEIEE